MKTLEELDVYPFSGHTALMRAGKAAWQDVDFVLGHFGEKTRSARKQYHTYVEQGVSQGRRSDLIGGGLIRSLGGWKGLLALRAADVRMKGDERCE